MMDFYQKFLKPNHISITTTYYYIFQQAKRKNMDTKEVTSNTTAYMDHVKQYVLTFLDFLLDFLFGANILIKSLAALDENVRPVNN